MPFLFVPDGGPEAEEYSSNYVWYDADDAHSVRRALDEVSRRRRSDEPAPPPRSGRIRTTADRLFLPSGWLPRVVKIDGGE